MCLLPRQSIDRRLSIPSASQRLHFTILQCCNEVNTFALCYDTRELSPLPRVPADAAPATRKWFHLKIAHKEESLGDHSSLRNVMWMEFDWLKRRSRFVSRLNGSVWKCFNRWCHLLLPALVSVPLSCSYHATPFYTPFLSLLLTLFFFLSHLMIFSTGSSLLAHPSSSLFRICKTFKMKNGWMDVFSSVQLCS